MLFQNFEIKLNMNIVFRGAYIKYYWVKYIINFVLINIYN